MAYFTAYPTYTTPSSSYYSPFIQLLDGFDDDDQPLYSFRPIAAATTTGNNAGSAQKKTNNSNSNNNNNNRSSSSISPPSAHRNQPTTTPATPAGAKVIRSFSPRFDVRESKDAYLLDGELPGVNQKDIDIEFTDPHTLRIRGVARREYTTTTTTCCQKDEEEKEGERSEEEHDHDDASSIKSASSYQATVEDAEDEEDDRVNKTSASSAAAAAKQTTTTAEKKKQMEEKQKKRQTVTAGAPTEPPFKYWSSERAVGSFHRTFNFPARVNQDAVRASLKDGILSVVVPKEVERKSGKKIVVTAE